MLPAVVSTAAGFKEMGSSILELITSTVAKTSATAADTTATIINKEMTGAAAKENMKKAIGDKMASGATRLHAGAQALLNG
jgi:hypothetical protein